MKCFYNIKGSLTIFVSLILTLVIIFTTILIDASKIILTRNLVSGAGDLTLSAGLSSYNTTLLDTYGLFANSKDEAELTENLRKYFEETLKHQSINGSELVDALTSLAIKGDAANLFDINVDEFKISAPENANLSNYLVLKSEILQYSKYRAPVSMGYGFLEKINMFKTLKTQHEVLEKKKEYEKKLKKIEDLCLEIFAKELALQSYAKGIVGKDIFSKPLEESYKLILNEKIDLGLKDSTELRREVLKPQSEIFYEANKNLVAIAFVEVEEKIPEGSTWRDKIEKDQVLDYTDIEEIKKDMQNHTGKLGELYNSKEEIISNLDSNEEEPYSYINKILDYFKEYKNSVDIFRDIDYLYEKKIKEIEEEIEKLQDIIDSAGEHEVTDNKGNTIMVEDDTSEEEAEIDALIEKMDELSTWHKDYERFAKEYDMEELREYFITRAKKQVEAHMMAAKTLIIAEHDWFDIYEEQANETKKLLDKLKKDSQILRRIKDEWGTTIEKLSDSGIKSNMQNDYESKTDILLESYIEDNIKILDNILNYSSQAKRDLSNIKYKGHSLVDDHINVDEVIEYMNLRIFMEKDYIIRSSQYLYSYVDDKIYAESAFTNSSVIAYGGKAYKQAELDLPYNENGEHYILGIEALEKEFGDTYPPPVALNNLVFERENMVSQKEETDNLYKIFKKMASRLLDIDVEEKKKQENKRNEVLKNETNLQEDNKREISEEIIENIMSTNSEVAEAVETNFGKDSGKIADNVIDGTKKALNGFEKLKDIAINGRDSLYLTEYATEMFSAYTTNFKDGSEVKTTELTLTGIPLNAENNSLYRAEQEYILLGNKEPKSNVDGVRNRIFAIRALLNLIFAYTGNPKLNTETFTMATTIAGWTGFGVPIVQNVLLIIAAVAESVYDTKDLMDGYSVALYKSVPTWKFYYSGLITDTLKDLGSATISNIVNTATDTLKNQSENLINTADNYVEQTIKNTRESIILYFQVPIQQLLLRAISDAKVNAINPLDRTKKIIRQGFEDLKQELNEQKSKLVGVDGASPLVIEAKLKVLEVFNTDDSIDDLAKMADKIIQAKQHEVSDVSKSLEDGVKDYFTKREEDIIGKITSIIDKEKLKAELKAEINKTIDEAGDNVQAGLNDAFNKFADKLDGSIPKDAGSIGAFDSNRASLLSMSYKEYLKLFILIQNLVNDQVLVERIGNLIQKNARKDDSEYFISSDFELKKSKTILNLEAKLGIKPSFLNLDFKEYGLDNEDFKDAARYKIKYKEVLGY